MRGHFDSRTACTYRLVNLPQLHAVGLAAIKSRSMQPIRQKATCSAVRSAILEPSPLLLLPAVPEASITPTHMLVLDRQPMLSDLLTTSTGPWQTVAWKVALDIILPLMLLWGVFHIMDWATAQARAAFEQRVQAGGDVGLELRRRSTLTALMLLAMRTPATFVLPPLLVAYTIRTALHIIDLVVHKYKPPLPGIADFMIRQISAQLVPLDTALQTALNITGVLFMVWFMVQLKDILIRDLILVRAIRSGRKELERVYVPLSSLVTWAAVLACGISICTSLGINLEPLLAVGGAGGIAAGFASQQVLTNIVSGINIFITRPFVIGDQVNFAGAPGVDIEGTVEGVEIMRTLVRTTEGTLVAVPNKLVAELVVFNRTRSLTAAPPAEAAAVAAAGPLRRVLCFHIQLARELEPLLDDVRADVREFLTSTTKQQLKESGFAPPTEDEEEEISESLDEVGEEEQGGKGGSAGSSSIDSRKNDNSSDGKGDEQDAAEAGGQRKKLAPVAAAVAAAQQAVSSAVAAVTRSPVPSSPTEASTDEDEAAGNNNSSVNGHNGHNNKSAEQPEPGALLVSITLSKLTEASIVLFVRCEMLLPAATMHDAVERQTEAALMGVSAVVRDRYGGVLLW